MLAQCDMYFNLLWFKIAFTLSKVLVSQNSFKWTLSDSTIWQHIHNISTLFYNPFIYKQDFKTNSPNSSWNTVNSLISGNPQELDKNVHQKNCLPLKMILTRGKQRNSGQMFAYWRVLYWTLVAFKLINSLLYHWQISVKGCLLLICTLKANFFANSQLLLVGCALTRECKPKQNPMFI